MFVPRSLVRAPIIAGNAGRKTGLAMPDGTTRNIRHTHLFGHPKGLTVLFATEMWERFSYFGMASLLVLYLVKYLLLPGHVENILGYQAVKGALESVFGPLAPQPLASLIFGIYTGLAYFTPILGGYLADRVWGQRATAIVGALLMAAGHFLMMFESLLFIALGFLILGIGAFKPNVSTQVGSLYARDDTRRVRAYSIYYVGINIGAFLAPLVCGTLGAEVGWHYGFLAAGIGMLIGTGIYLHGLRWLPPDELHRAQVEHTVERPFSTHERRAIIGLLLVFALTMFFWATYDQQGNTLLLWIEDHTERRVDLGLWKGEIPTTWFLALNPLMIFVFTPILIKLWAWQARFNREMSTIAKLSFGFLCVALANLVMVFAATGLAPNAKASPLWLVGYFTVVTVGELHLAPVGLALISRLAPPRVLSLMMGLWFAATFPGDVLGGWLGGFWSSIEKANFFLMIGTIAGLAGAAVLALNPALRSVFDERPDDRP
jgi:POT family proton-dependent oligopeptide transporter